MAIRFPTVMPRTTEKAHPYDFSGVSNALSNVRNQMNKNALMEMEREKMEAVEAERLRAGARANAGLQLRREQFEANQPLREAQIKLAQARATQAARGPSMKFFNTSSGVVGITPDGKSELIYEDPNAARQNAFIESIIGPRQTNAVMPPNQPPAPQGGLPTSQMPSVFNPQPQPTPQPQPQPQPTAAPSGLSQEGRTAIGISLATDPKIGRMYYDDVTRGRKAFDEKTADLYAKRYDKTLTQGEQARSMLNDLVSFEAALQDPNVYTGPFGQTLGAFKAFAEGILGAPVEGVAAQQVIDSMSKRFAVKLQDELDLGKLSDGDRTFLQEIVAGTNKSPEANRRLIGIARANAERQAALSRAAEDYTIKNNRFDSGFASIRRRIDNNFYKRIRRESKQWANKKTNVPSRSPSAGMMDWDWFSKNFGIGK